MVSAYVQGLNDMPYPEVKKIVTREYTALINNHVGEVCEVRELILYALALPELSDDIEILEMEKRIEFRIASAKIKCKDMPV